MNKITTDKVQAEVAVKLVEKITAVVPELVSAVAECKDFSDLETKVYGVAASLALGMMGTVLEGLDQLVTEGRGRKHQRQRCTILTRAGNLEFSRWRMKDGSYPLDEALGLTIERTRVSPWVRESAVRWSVDASYRTVADIMNEWIPGGGVSHQSVWNWVQEYGEIRATEERARCEEVYGQGKPTRGTERVPVLFTEADGVVIKLQKEKQKRAELKVAIGYEGLTKASAGGDRWTAHGKTVVSGIYEGEKLWEQMAVALGDRYDLSSGTKVILGGDGASWIQKGVEQFPGSEYVLCRFHMKRAISTALRHYPEVAKTVAELAEEGNWEAIESVLDGMIQSVGGDEKDAITKLKRYLEGNREGLRGYESRVAGTSQDARGLGIMEANVDKLAANRFKKNGRSWTVKGAHHLAKLGDYEHMGILSDWLKTHRELEPIVSETTRTYARELVKSLPKDPSDWLQRSVPVKGWKNAGWTEVIRHLVA